ncbi:MAG: hypothetical protein ACRDSZ_01075 [Pseudonocardiaceae bacterium]
MNRGSFVVGVASLASDVAAVAQLPDLTASSKAFSPGLTTGCGAMAVTPQEQVSGRRGRCGRASR